MKNFGKIKNAYNTVLVESIINKDINKKKEFTKYVKTLKENKALETQFFVYNNIENKIETNEFKAAQYVKETISLLDKFSKKELAEANDKLYSIIEGIESTNENEELYENINTLIFTEKNSKTIDAIVEATSKVVDYILNNKQIEKGEFLDIPNDLLSTTAVDKFNEEYNELSESEKDVIKTLIEATIEEKEKLFKETAFACVDLINNKLSESDINTKEKLLSVKDKLLRQTFNEESFTKDITKLLELKENLNIS